MTSINLKRRQLLASSLLGLLPGAWAASDPPATPAGPVVEVWKSPACGCCKDWVTHLEQNGFTVRVGEGTSAAARRRFGIADQYLSLIHI